MDSFLIDYLKSGKAWVLVGAGPSIEMGYPSWEKLASFAVEAATIEGQGNDLGALNAAMKRRDFPRVFEEAKVVLGGPRLLQVLQDKLTPSRSGEIYELIARWPVPVYLTTNYDDEIQTRLAHLEEAYIPYSNSEDHFKYLSPEFSGAVVKLHGDLRSENGLVLTTSQYRNIVGSDSWKYWRTKMTSIFQMNRVVVIGHSLSDENIRHVLEAAKQGAGVLQPICWIAPDVAPDQRKDFLEKYRIRVVSYDNHDGEHKNLLRLLQNVSEFIHSRTTVRIQEQIAKLSDSPLGNNAAAPGFFVFNKLVGQSDYDEKRIDIIIGIIQSVFPILTSLKQFTLKTALEIAGWPKDLPLSLEFSKRVEARIVEQRILKSVGSYFEVGDCMEVLSTESKKHFEHIRERFKQSLQLRAKRSYPALSDEDASGIASDIESSLSGYFREGGLKSGHIY